MHLLPEPFWQVQMLMWTYEQCPFQKFILLEEMWLSYKKNLQKVMRNAIMKTKQHSFQTIVHQNKIIFNSSLYELLEVPLGL